MVGQAGVLFPAGDAGALADALDRLIDAPEQRARLRDAGLEQSRAFTWTHTAARTREVWALAITRRADAHRD